MVLYNDFLILKSIVPSLPTSCYAPIARELQDLKDKLLKATQKTSFFSSIWKSNVQPLSLEIIMKMLQTVEKKNILLEDFLACSGYGKKLMETQT